ncbi:MAG: hypothetical protein ACK51M_01505, partial [Burkholderiales bacterium]
HGARGEAGVPVLVEPARGNLVVVAECGLGPEKYGDGGQEELARFRALALIDGWRAFAAPHDPETGRHARRTQRALRAALRDAAPAPARQDERDDDGPGTPPTP